MPVRPTLVLGAPRPATTDDIDALVRLINSAFRVEDFFVHGDRTSPADVATKLATAGSGFLVIDDRRSHDLAAAVHVEIRGARGYLGMLGVRPDRQGQGIGRILVAAVEDHCRAAGCLFLDLDIVDVRPELFAIYSALGFAPFDTGPFPNGFQLRRPVDLVLMTKPLVTLGRCRPSGLS